MKIVPPEAPSSKRNSHEFTATRLIWHNIGPWKTNILNKVEVPHDWPKKHTDVLEQIIDYKVPPDKFDDIATFDGSVIVERTKGTMSARCDHEEMNMLALNLAHDIAIDKRTAEEARKFYEDSIRAFLKGEKPAYMQKLQFEVPKGGTADPDKAVIQGG